MSSNTGDGVAVSLPSALVPTTRGQSPSFPKHIAWVGTGSLATGSPEDLPGFEFRLFQSLVTGHTASVSQLSCLKNKDDSAVAVCLVVRALALRLKGHGFDSGPGSRAHNS